MTEELIREIAAQLTPPAQYVLQALIEKQIRSNLFQVWGGAVGSVVCAVLMFFFYVKMQYDSDALIGVILSAVALCMFVGISVIGIMEQPIPEAVVLGRFFQR